MDRGSNNSGRKTSRAVQLNLNSSINAQKGRTLVGRLETDKNLNKGIVVSMIKKGWGLDKGMELHELPDNNAFIFRFPKQEDYIRVLKGRPWSIQGALLNLQHWEEFTVFHEVDFDWCPFWIQFHGLPHIAFDHANAVTLGNAVGKTMMFESPKIHDKLTRTFIRARVLVNIWDSITKNTTIADILEPTYVPPIVSSFFPPGNIKCFEGTRVPLMVVQVTELLDGIFMACSMNHCVADVKPYWNFLNAWAQISRNGLNHIAPDSKLTPFKRWFPHGNIERPITIPFRAIIENHHLKESTNTTQSPPFSRRIFHFNREKIAQLKTKANSEIQDSVTSNKISSLQAVLAHVWRSSIRNQNLDPEDEVTYSFLISASSRVSKPPIPDDYFGITVQFTTVTMKVRDLVGHGGLGKFASEMNKAISSCTEEKIKRDFEAWVRNPTMYTEHATIGKFMKTSSSPRANFYNLDFGWGRPVAVRGGQANAKQWKLMADAGAEEGSFDIELCASYEVLEALARDLVFMHAVQFPCSPAELSPSSQVARTRL
ncbi:hypothetical protein K1719_040444 [Acacia pycnantha]|nr:hypothetical protein K1719_040444 [Acacia pycnantha]